MAPSDSLCPKIGGRCKQRAIIFHGGWVSQFCPKIRCHVNRGRQGEKLNDTIGEHGPEDMRAGANSAQLSFTGTELYRCEISHGCNAKFCNLLNGCYGSRSW